MKLNAIKRNGKYIVTIFGAEHEIVLPKEPKKVKKTSKKISKKSK
jgi:hypothetical protein